MFFITGCPAVSVSPHPRFIILVVFTVASFPGESSRFVCCEFFSFVIFQYKQTNHVFIPHHVFHIGVVVVLEVVITFGCYCRESFPTFWLGDNYCNTNY